MRALSSLAAIRDYIQTNAARLDPESRYVAKLPNLERSLISHGGTRLFGRPAFTIG